MITAITYQSPRTHKLYAFDITYDSGGLLLATCLQTEGGLNTFAKDWNNLADAVVDCVATWELH